MVELNQSFDNKRNRLWFIALTEGGLLSSRHFPVESTTVSEEACYMCEDSETEIVVHESNDGFPRNRFLHYDCFESYVEEFVDGKYVSIYEVVTVEQHPEKDFRVSLEDDMPDEVFEAYMRRLESKVDKQVD